MVLLIILVVATAVLIAWLLVALGRVTLGEFRFPRLREGSVQGASPVGSPVPPVPSNAGDHATDTAARDLDGDQNRREPRPPRDPRPLGRLQKRRGRQVLYEETDVEQAVRDRLYGRHD